MTDYTLITNLTYVQLPSGIRAHCNALLVSLVLQSQYPWERSTLRGFGTEPTSEHFDMVLDNDRHFPFTMLPAESSNTLILKSDGGAAPLATGSILTFAEGTSIALVADDSEQPIDVQDFSGDIMSVWDALPQKVAKYWNAPNMPFQQYVSADMVRNSFADKRRRAASHKN